MWPNAQVKEALADSLKQRALLPFAEGLARHKQVIESLLIQYPRDLEVHVARINTGRYEDHDAWTALRDHYVREASRHPDDPLAVALAGVALFRKDTPETVRLLARAEQMAPQWGWPSMQPASVYDYGRLANKEKLAEHIRKYFDACPDSTDPTAHLFLTKAGANDLQAQLALKLRQRLMKEERVEDLPRYELLWAYEFRSRPVAEYRTVRWGIAADLKRLEGLRKQPNAEWLMFLRGGYQQSGASKEQITAIEERLLQTFPSSREAYEVLSARWHADHKQPDDHKDQQAWRKYNASYAAILDKWIHPFPAVTSLISGRFYAARDQAPATEREGLALVDRYLENAKFWMPYSATQLLAAEFLLEQGWQPGRALALLKEAELLMLKEQERAQSNDSLSDDDRKATEKVVQRQRQRWLRLMLQANRRLAQPAVAGSWRSEIEGTAPAETELLSDYWWNRAVLAALEDRKADALTYYQNALATRTEEPRFVKGRLRDELGNEAHAFYSGLGGTEQAWRLWSQRPQKAHTKELTKGRWKAATLVLPQFDLQDVQGKPWRLKDLGGKSLLINLWATWCGPCQAELPKLQQLYHQTRDRADIQILTFNVDGEVGVVEPYLKDKGYSFPVILAYDFVAALLNVIAIPQNWIVDPGGQWRWMQLGFDDSEPNWVQTMVQRLESVR
ncbi:MAG: TlpA disulfide reductase family protein [Acidobacteriota bacterium]